MKQFWKKGLMLLLCAVLLIGFTGCDRLEQMRACQAFCQENGDILWQGKRYKKLPPNKYFSPVQDYHQNTIYLTQSDMPVLLSQISGNYESTMISYHDGAYLQTASYAENSYYCREDLYEETVAQLESPFVPEVLCLQYWDHGEGFSANKRRTYVLTEEQSAATKHILATIEPKIGQGNNYQGGPIITLFEASQNLLLKQCYAYIILEGDHYSLQVNDGDIFYTYRVPENDKQLFADLVNNFYP